MRSGEAPQGSRPAADDLERSLVREALTGDAAARAELVQRFTPVFRHRVRRALRRHAAARGRHVGPDDVSDLLQEVQLIWWVRSERVLGSWDPERGLSLRNFAGLFAERAALSVLRSRRDCTWAEHPNARASLDELHASHDPERTLSARQQVQAVLHRLERRVSARSFSLFGALVAHQCTVDELSRRLGTSENAIYCAIARVRAELRALGQERELDG